MPKLTGFLKMTGRYNPSLRGLPFNLQPLWDALNRIVPYQPIEDIGLTFTSPRTGVPRMLSDYGLALYHNNTLEYAISVFANFTRMNIFLNWFADCSNVDTEVAHAVGMNVGRGFTSHIAWVRTGSEDAWSELYNSGRQKITQAIASGNSEVLREYAKVCRTVMQSCVDANPALKEAYDLIYLSIAGKAMVEPYDQAQLLFDQTGIEHAISAWVAQTYDQTAGWRMEPPDGDLNLELLYDLLGLDLTEEIYIGSDL